MKTNKITLHYNEVYDFIASLFRLALDKEYKTMGQEHGLNIDPGLKTWVKNTLDSFSVEEKEKLDFYFDQENHFGRELITIAYNQKKSTIPEFLTYLEKLKPKKLIFHLLCASYQGEKEWNFDLIKEWMNNENINLYSLITENFSSSQQGNWRIFKLLSNPKTVKNELLEFLKNYYWDIYDKKAAQAVEIVEDYCQGHSQEIKQAASRGLKHIEGYDNYKGNLDVIVSYYCEFADLGFLNDLFVIGYRYQEFVQTTVANQGELKENIYVFKALADEVRLDILKELADNPKYTAELAKKLEISSPGVNYHLKKFHKAGLIKVDKAENKVYYKLNKRRLKEIVVQLDDTFKLF